MKIFSTLCYLVLFFSWQIGSAQSSKKQVMLLGVYHFASNNDMIKSKLDDVTTDKRQLELADLANKLQKFKPDKIFIEWNYSRNGIFLDSTYDAYINNNFELRNNEVYQIGYRLGKILGHNKLYCMDAPGKWLYDTLVYSANKNNQQDILDSYLKEMAASSKEFDSLNAQRSIIQNFIALNSENKSESWKGNFVLLAPYIGNPGEYEGSEFLGEWYKRNIRMYSNIIRTVDANDERILVIVGNGHKPIINQMFEMNSQWKIVDPVYYLKK